MGVGDVDFDVEGAGGLVDGVGVAGDGAFEDAAGVLVEGEGGFAADADGGRVGLGDGDEDADLVDGGEVEELRASGAVFAGVDEGADVGVAGGDDAVEGGVDFFEGLELLEAADGGHGGLDGGFFGGGVAHGDVGLLLGDGVGLEQILVAGGGGVGEVEVGLGAFEIGFGDLELLVELGGFDLGHELALADVGADIEVPLFQIAAGAGVDGGVGEGLGVSGQCEIRGEGRGDGMDDADDGDGGDGGLGFEGSLRRRSGRRYRGR